MSSRKKFLDKLLHRLRPQLTDDVEIIVNDEGKKWTTGYKRNFLLKQAKGKYIVFVDDDDMVSYDYVKKILKGIEDEPDCCGIEGIVTFNGERAANFVHSKRYGQRWTRRKGVFYRPPNHLNPVRRSLARKAGFPNIVKREDRAYSDKLYPMLKKETLINGPIYYYLCRKPPEEEKKVATGPYEINKVTLYGDFEIEAKLKITGLGGSASGVLVDGSVLGFEGCNSKCMFVEGGVFKGISFKPVTSKYLKEGKAFFFKIKKSKNKLKFFINDERLFSVNYTKKKTKVGFRPMRSTMRIMDFDVKELA